MDYAVGVGSQLFIVRYDHKCLVHDTNAGYY